eukprot:c9135_g1_i1.p1 GENE.c9135_g1_i1~~c9135_g1_i1.p1  ORF type:complete len:343 (-),score=82.36 c9135_g1_i1:109-1137(-)
MSESNHTPAMKYHLERKNSKSFLMEVSLGHFVESQKMGGTKKKKLVFVKTTSSIRDAVAQMQRAQVLSIPVWDDSTKEFVCFLSVLDLFKYILKHDVKSSSCLPSSKNSTPVSEVVKDLGDDDAVQIDLWNPESPVSSLMEWFTMGIHRIMVQDTDSPPGTPNGFIVSQSDIVQYLHSHAGMLGAVNNKTLDEHHYLDADTPSIGPGRLNPIAPDVSLEEAAEQLFAFRTSAVPIVEKETGKLIASLSASDLRGVSFSEIHRLCRMPVLQFLKRHRAHQNITPFTVLRTATLGDVMRMMSEQHCHRVWVVDEDGKLVGVITLTDVLCKFAPFDYKLLHSRRI